MRRNFKERIGTSSFGKSLGSAMRDAFQPNQVLAISRDPFIKWYRTDFRLFGVKLDGKALDDLQRRRLITAVQGAAGTGHIDLFVRDEFSHVALLDGNGQPQRERVTGDVEIVMTHEPEGCTSCTRKAAQDTKWWPN